jgi:hypothetical protein
VGKEQIVKSSNFAQLIKSMQMVHVLHISEFKRNDLRIAVTKRIIWAVSAILLVPFAAFTLL